MNEINNNPRTIIIGEKVKKTSGRPFKSGFKMNTVNGVINHPKLNIPCFTFEEDNSYVEVRRCEPQLNELDLSILKYYKEGKEMSGFEKNAPWSNLVENDYLDDDLDLTIKGWEFIKQFPDWDNVIAFNNKTYLSVKCKLS